MAHHDTFGARETGDTGSAAEQLPCHGTTGGAEADSEDRRPVEVVTPEHDPAAGDLEGAAHPERHSPLAPFEHIGSFGENDTTRGSDVVDVGAEPGAVAGQRAQLFLGGVEAAVELGGTVTGEHGVGLLKRHGMTREMSETALDMHRAIKNALDPRGILNPGKIFSM